MARPKTFDPDVAVDKAMQVFWSRGYAGTTPQGLVDALGIGSGSLYNAFGGKRDLFERALRRYQERETARVIAILDGAGPVRERLRAAVQLVLDATRSDAERRGCMITNTAIELATSDELINHLVRRAFDRQEAAFRSTLEEGMRNGELDATLDADALAALFVTMLNGIRVMAKADPGAPRIDHLTSALQHLLDTVIKVQESDE